MGQSCKKITILDRKDRDLFIDLDLLLDLDQFIDLLKLGYYYTPCARDHWHFQPRGSFDAAQGAVDRRSGEQFSGEIAPCRLNH